jgi:hypothetical protein
MDHRESLRSLCGFRTFYRLKQDVHPKGSGGDEVCSHEIDLKKNPPWINFSK